MTKQLKQSDLPILREKLHKEQNGICPILNKPLQERTAIDHHHKKGLGGTGNVRALIDSNVNVYLGKIENNCKRYCISLEELPNVLRNIADYLEKGDYIDEEGYKLIHPTEKEKEPILKKSSYNKLKKVYDLKAKFPEYKNKQKYTKLLEKLFVKYNLEPEFY